MKRETDEMCLNLFAKRLQQEEKSEATIAKYLRDIAAFLSWSQGREIGRELVLGWKAELQDRGLRASTMNGKLAALNRYLKFTGRADCCVKLLRLQRRVFRARERELSRTDYGRLVRTAYGTGKKRLALLMETICSTGIRVSELAYITVESVRNGRAEIALKGKIRTILLPRKLCRKLRQYGKENRIVSGPIFLTRNGTPLSRKQIWAEMKALCRSAGVDQKCVFPHNLRHLFAVAFYHACRDIVKLADILGHSNIETTRIYLVTTGEKHAQLLDRLKLIG